jgi:hypothetical protein
MSCRSSAWPIGSAGNHARVAGDVTGPRSARSPKIVGAKDFQQPSTSSVAVHGPRVTSAQTAEAMTGRAVPDRIRVDVGRRLDRTAAVAALTEPA